MHCGCVVCTTAEWPAELGGRGVSPTRNVTEIAGSPVGTVLDGGSTTTGSYSAAPPGKGGGVCFNTVLCMRNRSHRDRESEEQLGGGAPSYQPGIPLVWMQRMPNSGARGIGWVAAAVGPS